MSLNPRQGLPAFLLRHTHQVTEASARTSTRATGQATQTTVEIRLVLSVKPEDVHELLHNVEAEVCEIEEEL
jgi:hypothetical protein